MIISLSLSTLSKVAQSQTNPKEKKITGAYLFSFKKTNNFDLLRYLVVILLKFNSNGFADFVP
jgi:hypothetical protein